MKRYYLYGMIIILLTGKSQAQVAINADNTLPDQSAMLDVKSATKGMLVPRLTQSQLETITNPVNGLLVFCTTDNKFYVYIAGSGLWKEVLYGPGTLSPTCGTPVTDPRDGKTYQTVRIGTQCWMEQNLNVGTRINGSQTQSNNATLEKYCYGNLESNCDMYGGLYQWGEMMQFVTIAGAQGICFDGWHLPSDEDMMLLTNFLGGLSVAGGKLKEGGSSHWQTPNTGATNESGFTALPGSYRDYLGSFSGLLGYRTSFWSSTQNGGSYAWDYSVYYDAESVVRSNGALKTNGFSVRCIKNDPF